MKASRCIFFAWSCHVFVHFRTPRPANSAQSVEPLGDDRALAAHPDPRYRHFGFTLKWVYRKMGGGSWTLRVFFFAAKHPKKEHNAVSAIRGGGGYTPPRSARAGRVSGGCSPFELDFNGNRKTSHLGLLGDKPSCSLFWFLSVGRTLESLVFRRCVSGVCGTTRQ